MYEPKPTARLGMSAYGGETVAPAMPFDKLNSILGEPPSMQPLKDLTSGTSPKLRLRPPMTPRIGPSYFLTSFCNADDLTFLLSAPFEQNLRGSHDSNAILMPRIESDARRPPRGATSKGRKVRSSALQKLVKKYDGSGDPFDHVAAFKQAVHAKQVSDTQTQVEGNKLAL